MSVYILWKESRFEREPDDLVAAWSRRPSIEAVAREMDIDLSDAAQSTVVGVVLLAVGPFDVGWTTIDGPDGNKRNFKIDEVTEAAP